MKPFRLHPLYLVLFTAMLLCMTCGPAGAAVLPAGFVETTVGSGWATPVGLVFGPNATRSETRAYIWEKEGRIWIVRDGVRLSPPLLDITEEVGSWGHAGLLSVALDPDFATNGYIYCLYVVDRHHLLKFGTPEYRKDFSINLPPTIGRLTRYTCRRSDDFRSVDPASRRILLGEYISNGIPVIHTSHTVGAVLFGTDGTLLVSTGDGASFNATDNGGDVGGSFGTQALADGIITAAENNGAYRCQMPDSLSGKILRLDPATGDGVASNPYFQSAAPRSARSRVWSLGLRNPFRMALKPGTGAHNPALANPGTLYVGDVGWLAWEEMTAVTGPGQNLGWPLYEGYGQQMQYWNARPAGMTVSSHRAPAIHWKHGGHLEAAVSYNGTRYLVGGSGSPVTGANFTGNAASGSAFYSGSSFPAAWRGSYFQADFAAQWIRVFTMDAADQVTSVREFANGEAFVFLTVHPGDGSLYYCAAPNGTKAGTVRRVEWAPSGNRPPSAAASVDRQYGTSPLTVQFSSALSSDPENGALTYTWDFGDGTSSTLAHPAKTYTGTGAKKFTATLTVRDAAGALSTSSVIITLNNTPPVINITSPAPGVKFPVQPGTVSYPLTATATDDTSTALTWEWFVSLVHDDHEHPEFTLNAPSGTLSFLPIGGDRDTTHYYRIILRVTDSLGLSSETERLFMPETGTASVEVQPDMVSVPGGGAKLIRVLANDHGAVTDADWSTLEITSAPAFGTAEPDPVAGGILYRQDAARPALADQFSYRVRTRAGTLSASASVDILINPAASSAPVAVSDSVMSPRGGSASFSPAANDLTLPGSTLSPASLVLLTKPRHGVLTLQPAAGILTYTHGGGAEAADFFTYSIADSSGRRSEPGTILVRMGDVPAITPPGPQHSVRGSILSLTLSAVASSFSGPVTWTATGLPPGLRIGETDGRITGTVSLSAPGANTVTVTARNGAGASSLSFPWTTAAEPAPRNGLRGEYFTGIVPGTGAVLTRTETEVNYDWGTGAPAPGVPADQFCVRWSGEITARFTEPHTFTIAGDNGYRLWIDGVLLIDNWLPVGTGGWRNASALLTAGRPASFRLEYYEEWGGAGITLYWNSQRQPWEVISGDRFSQPPAGASAAAAAINKTLTISPAPAAAPAITFTRAAGSPLMFLETSPDLRTWQRSDAPALITQTGSMETVRIGPPAATGRRYYRIKVVE